MKISTAFKSYVSKRVDVAQFDANDLRETTLAENYALADKALKRAGVKLADAIDALLTELPPQRSVSAQLMLQDLYAIGAKARKGEL